MYSYSLSLFDCFMKVVYESNCWFILTFERMVCIFSVFKIVSFNCSLREVLHFYFQIFKLFHLGMHNYVKNNL